MHFGSNVHSANEWNDEDFCGKTKMLGVRQFGAGVAVLLPNSLFLLLRSGRFEEKPAL